MATTAVYLVTLRLPDHISPEQAEHELQTCISFGQPEIRLYFSTEDEHGPESDSKVPDRPEVLPDGISP